MRPTGEGHRVRRPLKVVVIVLVGALAGMVAGCSGSDEATLVDAARLPEPLEGFGVATLIVDGEHEWPVMLANTPDLRRQGLMNVTGLGDWAGMAFVYSEPTESSFWMKDTLIPLTVLWVGADGGIVAEADMVPCEPGQDCLTYAPGAVYVWALEVRSGGAADLGITANSTLVLSDLTTSG